MYTSHRSLLTYENRLLLILCVTSGFVFFDRLALSFLFPFISDELHLSEMQLGLMSSALSLTWALSGALSGAWSDARGIRKPILLLAVLGFSVCAAASSWVVGFMSLLILRALMGLFEGPVLPMSQSLMVDSSTPARRGLNMGLLQGSSPGLIGGVIGPPVVIGIATHYGWRDAFYVSCIAGLVLALCIWLWVKEKPIQIQPVQAQPESNVSRWALLRERNILLCVLIGCCFLTWFVVIISFAPTFLMKYRHFSATNMTIVMTCLGAAWVFWGFVVPGLSDRMGRKTALLIFSPIAALCPIAMIYGTSVMSLGLFVFLTYTGLGCFTLFMSTIPAETVPRHSIASALGLIMGTSELVGGFFAPIVAGFAADHYGLAIAMWMAAAAAMIAGLFSAGLKETAPIVLKKQTDNVIS